MSFRGNQKLAILRCKFSDKAQEPNDDAYYRDLFITRGTEGLNDYYRTASIGAINFDDSDLFPWKTLALTQSDFFATYAGRGDRIQAGIDAHGIDRNKYAIVIVIVNDDSGNSGSDGGNGILAGATVANDMQVTFFAHEMGHKFGLNDSYDESDRLIADDHTYGWYWDQYDIMSARNVFSHSHPRWGTTGPLMCTANQDWNKWIPAGRIFSLPPGTNDVDEVDIVSLGHTDMPGYVCVKFDRWYVEFRTPDGLDSGLARPCVLIHSITPTANATVHARDVSVYNNEWQVGDVFGPSDAELNIAGGTQVEVLSFNLKNYTARLRIRTATARNPPIRTGPGRIFGGVAVDGGGIIILPGGGVIHIGPWSPLLGMLGHVAIVAQAEERLTGRAKAVVVGQMYKEIEGMAGRASKRVGGSANADEAEEA